MLARLEPGSGPEVALASKVVRGSGRTGGRGVVRGSWTERTPLGHTPNRSE